MNAIQLFGYLRDYSSLKLHEVPSATDMQLADGVTWSTHDFRDDSDWICVAIGSMSMERLPTTDVASSAVALLRQKQVAVRAECEACIVEIDRQINSLLAITHEVEE